MFFLKTGVEFIAGCDKIDLYPRIVLDSQGGIRVISFSEAWINLVNVLKSFRPTDVLDILITSFLVYKLITWAKVTRTGQLVKGLLALVIAYFLADWMQLQTMKYTMQYLFSNGLILLAVIFQPELRTALERVGRSRISKLDLFSHQEEKSVDQ